MPGDPETEPVVLGIISPMQVNSKISKTMALHSIQYQSRSTTHYVRARKASSRFFRASNSSSEDPCFDWDGPKPEEGPTFGRLSSGNFELVAVAVAVAVLAILGSANSRGSS